MSDPNDNRSRDTEDSLEPNRARKAADRINCRIAFDYKIEFWSPFVDLTVSVERAYAGEYALFIAGDYGEIAVAPEHYHFFTGVDLSDLGIRHSEGYKLI